MIFTRQRLALERIGPSSAIARTPKRVHNPVFVKLQSDGGHGLNGLDWFRVQPGYDLLGCVLPLRHSRSLPSSFSTLLAGIKADMSPKEPKTGPVGDTL